MANRAKKPASIGIDLGTSYCCVGTWKNNKVEIIPNDMGERTTPSFVAFTDTERLIGTAAKNQATRNPHNTIFHILRLIGRNYHDISMENDMESWPFQIEKASNDRIAIQVEYKGEKRKYFAEQILAMIIKYMKQIAEEYIGTTVNNAVISVPIHFTRISQMDSIKIAGKLAGLNILRIVASSTCAAIAYGLDQNKSKNDDEINMLIFDLGGNSCDISLISWDDGVVEVKAVAYHRFCGGKDFDDMLVKHFVKEIKRKTKTDCTKSKRAMQRLRVQCERAKRSLSSAARAFIEIDSIFSGYDFASTVTRASFEDLCMEYFRICLNPINDVLKEVKYSKTDIGEIVLVGGSTRIPRIQQMIEQYFNGKKLCKSVNPDEVTARGASIQAAILSGDEMGDAGDLLLLDVIPTSLGVEICGTEEEKKENATSSIRTYAIGHGGIMSKLIEKNKNIPCKANETFTTKDDNQPGVLIYVYEGEETSVNENVLLGKFELMGIPPAARGVPQIEVTFDIEANSILSVTAKDKKNQTYSKQIIIDISGFSEQEINEMVAEAEKYKDEDNENRKRIEDENEMEKKEIMEEELLKLELMKERDINKEQSNLIKQLKNENMILKSENNGYKNKLILKDDELNKLYLDYKELELKLKEKKRKNGYKDWDFNDVFEWIINIENERFKKYQQKLFNKLKEENIDGTCLDEMDANDLHRFGITEFKDKKILIKHIKNLIIQNNQQNNNNANDNNNIGQDEGIATAYY